MAKIDSPIQNTRKNSTFLMNSALREYTLCATGRRLSEPVIFLVKHVKIDAQTVLYTCRDASVHMHGRKLGTDDNPAWQGFDMDCDLCGDNEATNHIRVVIDGDTKSLNLCSHCANKKKINPNMFEGVALAELLYNFADMTKEAPTEQPAIVPQISCPTCELTSTEFQKSGLLGCADCYEVFKPFLLEALPSLHKGVNHVGKMIELPDDGSVPAFAVEAPVNRVKDLQAALRRAVSNENYEEAAALRDEIKNLTEDEPSVDGLDDEFLS
jgi:protein arginine kinase activator